MFFSRVPPTFLPVYLLFFFFIFWELSMYWFASPKIYSVGYVLIDIRKSFIAGVGSPFLLFEWQSGERGQKMRNVINYTTLSSDKRSKHVRMDFFILLILVWRITSEMLTYLKRINDFNLSFFFSYSIFPYSFSHINSSFLVMCVL